MDPYEFATFAKLNYHTLLALIESECRTFFKTKAMFITQIVTPILYFIFIIVALAKTIGNVEFAGTVIGYPEYAIVGLVCMTVMSQMSRTIYRITVDRRYGFYALKVQSGVKHILYVLVMGTSSILGYTVQLCMLFVLVRMFNLNISAANFLLVTLLGFLAMLFWVGVGTILTMGVRNYQTRDLVLTFMIMPLSFSAPLFYVLEDAPTFIKYIAAINPLTYQLQALREVAFSTITIESMVLNICMCVISLFIAAVSVSRASLTVDKFI